MNRRQKALRRDRILGIAAVVTIAIAWFLGSNLAVADLQPFLEMALPGAARFEKTDNITYAAWGGEGGDQLIGYVSISSADGYGGPMTLAVAVDLEGQVIGLAIVDHKETPSYLRRVLDRDLPESLLGKNYLDSFAVGEDIDAISGATYTTVALAESVRDASRAVALAELGLEVPVEAPPEFVFGVPEIMVIALFAVGFVGHQRKFKYKKAVRWASMLAGLLVLGVLYNRPLTLSHINQLLLGYWPDWRTNLYWYLLLGGIFFVFTVDNKNPYCEWFCPFGAAQECMGAIGGAKTRSTGRYRDPLKWAIRIVTWLAVLTAILLRNPGVTSYEVFGTLFSLTGSNFQFVLLGVVLVAALFIRRPWCTYLCPLGPVTDLYRSFRKWVLEIWRKRRPRPAV